MQKTQYALPEHLPEWGVSVFESHHAPDFQMEWRRHRFYKIVYVLAGSGRFCFENRETEFESGDLFLVPPGTKNRIVDDPACPASVYVLCVARSVLRLDQEAEKHLVIGKQPRSLYLAHQAESLLRRLLYQRSQSSVAKRFLMTAAVLELMAILLGAGAVQGEAAAGEPMAEMHRYLRELDNRFFEATTIDAAASQLGLSRRTFTKLFREATGKPWLAYVHERAIDHAARLLRESTMPIASVAFECGFRDLSTFYRRFKSLRGCTPAQWGKQLPD